MYISRSSMHVPTYVLILDIRINRERLIVSKRHTYVTYFSRPDRDGPILDACCGSINQIKCKAYIITDSRPTICICYAALGGLMLTEHHMSC